MKMNPESPTKPKGVTKRQRPCMEAIIQWYGNNDISNAMMLVSNKVGMVHALLHNENPNPKMVKDTLMQLEMQADRVVTILREIVNECKRARNAEEKT